MMLDKSFHRVKKDTDLRFLNQNRSVTKQIEN